MRRRTSLLPSTSRKRRERYVGWREPACRMRPLTTVLPPARFMHTYTGPVGTRRRRARRAWRGLRRGGGGRARAEADDVVRLREVLRFVVCVLVVGVVLAAS